MMIPKLKDNQLFFKNLLIERVKDENEYKEYSTEFGLDLIGYDLYNEDIKRITQLIIETDKFTYLNIRLNNTLTEKYITDKLFRKISLKRKFTSLGFYIKYLSDELLSIFIEFIGKLENHLNSLEISIKYLDKKRK